ncbi:MAG: trypsin-like peptidase domain-containing protein [Planctomycetia bacterium]|nr:trypsin-like peptidase domain-containing protein [Planctomycetia bacterium]
MNGLLDSRLVLSLTLISLLSVAAPAPAQEPSGLQAAIALEQVLTQAIERAEKSVVSIARFHQEEVGLRDFRPEIMPRPGMLPFDPTMQTPTNPDFVPNDFATGVIVDKAGFVVTNLHAIDGPGEIWVTTIARRPLRAAIVATDARSDLAMLRVDGIPTDMPFPPIKFGDGSKLKKGQIVLALGNPYAIARDGQVSASWGIIANLSRKSAPDLKAEDPRDRKKTIHHFGTLIQTDAKLNLGTSGGALLNLQGEMIGLTTSQAAVAGFEQAAGYAMPIDELFLRVVDTLKQGKKVDYGLLGVSSSALTPGERAAGVRGVRVETVRNGSPAERAGLFPGDIITQISGKPIDDVDGLMLLVGKQPAGNVTSIAVERDGRLFPINVTLAKFEVRGKNISTAPEPIWRGLRVDFPSAHPELDPQFNQGFRVGTSCVLAYEVDPNSAAWAAGVRRGMLITHVKNVPVDNPQEFYDRTKQLKGEVELRIGAMPTQPPVVKVGE